MVIREYLTSVHDAVAPRLEPQLRIDMNAQARTRRENAMSAFLAIMLVIMAPGLS